MPRDIDPLEMPRDVPRETDPLETPRDIDPLEKVREIDPLDAPRDRTLPGRSVRGEGANFTRLVLGCVEAKF